jgi:hypothetical protein
VLLLLLLLLLPLPPTVRFLKHVQLVIPGTNHSLWELTQATRAALNHSTAITTF